MKDVARRWLDWVVVKGKKKRASEEAGAKEAYS
jgi:hypothetical protein